MCWFRSLALSLLTLVLTPSLAMADFEEDYESKQWQEVEVALPAAPKEASKCSKGVLLMKISYCQTELGC